jgi:3-hydroxybutyrate dehydrogenase
MRLTGKVALITGAASGIGYAIARGFAAEGALVAVADLDREKSESAAQSVEQASGVPCLGIAMDVTDEDAVEAGVMQTVGQLGGLDILVSNAGVQVISSIDQLSYRDWQRVTAVHLDGAFLTTRACLRLMYASGKGGAIIYMGSVHSKLASVFKAPYVAAKHGILGLCRVVAKEGAAHGVRAYVICPGFVKTPLVQRQIPQQAELLRLSEDRVIKDVLLKDTVDGEFTTTEEIVDAAVFLASQKTMGLTGQSLVISHGWSMQ